MLQSSKRLKGPVASSRGEERDRVVVSVKNCRNDVVLGVNIDHYRDIGEEKSCYLTAEILNLGDVGP
jgi:hypothetical protein